MGTSAVTWSSGLLFRLLYVSALILICIGGLAVGQNRKTKFLNVAVEDLDIYKYLTGIQSNAALFKASLPYTVLTGTTLNFIHFPVRGRLSSVLDIDTVVSRLSTLEIHGVLSDYYISLAIGSISQGIPYFIIRKTVTTQPPNGMSNMFSIEIDNVHQSQILYDLSVEYQRSSLFIVSDGSPFSSQFLVNFADRLLTMSTVNPDSTDEDLYNVFTKFSPNALTTGMGWVLLFDEPNLPLMERTLEQASRAGVLVDSQYFFVPSLFEKQKYLTRFYRSASQIFTFFLPGVQPPYTRNDILQLCVLDCLNHYLKSYATWTFMPSNATILDALAAESSIQQPRTGAYVYDPSSHTRDRVQVDVYRTNASRPVTSIFSLAGRWRETNPNRKEGLPYIPYYDGADVVSQSQIKFVAFRSLPYFYDYNETSETAEGLSMDILNAMRERLEFRYKLIIAANENEAVDMLKNGSADVSLNFLEPTQERLAYVDTSIDMVQDGIQMMIKRVVFKVDFLNVFYPFSFYVWMSIVLGIILLSVTLYITDRISPNTKGKPTFTPFESFFLVLSSFLMSKVENEPRKVSSRIFTILLWFATLMYMTTYLSNLVAFLIQSDAQIVVSHVSDLQDISSHKWGWVKDQIFEDDIQTNWPELYSKAQRLWPDQMYYKTMQEALAKVLSDANFILLANADVLGIYKNTNCSLLVMGNLANSHYNTWLFRKGFRFRNDLNNQLRERKDTDFAQLRSKYFDLKRCYSGRTDIANRVPLGFEYFCGPFALLGIGILLGFLQLLTRWIYQQLREWSRLKEQMVKFKLGRFYQAEVYDAKPNGVWIRIEGDSEVRFLDNASLYVGDDPLAKRSNSSLLGQTIQIKFVGNCGVSGVKVFERQMENPAIATGDSDNSDQHSNSTREDSA